MDLAAGVALVKAGLDTLKVAIGLAKEVQGVLPPGERKDAVGTSLAEAERQLRLAEAQIAQGLGYDLCRCEFPPHPMVLVGYQQSLLPSGEIRRTEVFQCASCKRTRPPGGYLTNGRTMVASKD
jgi:hypothetical protein